MKSITNYSNFPSIAGSTMYKTIKTSPETSNNSLRKINNNTINNISNPLKTYFPKTLKNFHKRRPLSPESANLSKNETDDTLFGLSEVKLIDDKIHKRKNNRRRVWEIKSNNNIYGINASKNKQEIMDIHYKTLNGDCMKNFDLKSEIDKKKYFPVEKCDNIIEAEKIMQEIYLTRENQQKAYKKFGGTNRVDMHTFTYQNREIFLKNILLNLLNSEREKINGKEEAVSTALKSAYKEFEKDKEMFQDYTILKQKQFKELELKLGEAIHTNKLLLERTKLLNQEYRSTHDEIDKTLRDIVKFKSYADFIHYAIHPNEKITNISLDWMNLKKKDKDIEMIVSKLINQFSFLLDDYNYIPEFFQDPILLGNIFFTLESNIIKLLSKKEDEEEELFKVKKELDEEIEELKEKVKIHEKELEEVKYEFQKEKMIVPPNYKYQELIDTNMELIYELYGSLLEKNITEKDKHKTLIEVIKECCDTLKNKEKNLNLLIDEMQKIQNENESMFKKFLDKKKNENKIEKYKEGKEKIRRLQEERNLKYLQRMNRYKVRGPIVFPPPWVLNDSKKKREIERAKNKIDENEMLYYY